MRLDNIQPVSYTQNPAAARYSSSPLEHAPNERQGQNRPGDSVDISPEGRAAYADFRSERSRYDTDAFGISECKTCASRTYRDVSDDPSVSFQTPTHISPGQSAALVAAHENEHVSNEQARAEQEGREIVSQTVTLRSSICPECKRVYISGGTTYTISRQNNQPET